MDFEREVVQFFFLKLTGNTDLKKKIDVGKHAILSHFLIVKIPGQSIPLIYLLRQIPVGVLRSIVLLRSQSSFACFSLVNQPIERSKLVLVVRPTVYPVVRPAVAHPNQIYKQKYMKNANAKL